MILYKGYVEAYLTMQDLPQFNEDMLYLLISDHKYGERVPVQIGAQVIDHLILTMTEKELQQAEEISKQVHLSTVISKRNTMKSMMIPQHDLKGV